MVQQFKKPCSELEQLLPTIKSYYLRKASAERARSGAVAVEAPQYAKKQYDEANEAYEKALRLADADDYSKAFAQMELVYEMFKAAEEAA